MTRATIEVFAEIACPFTHVGLRRIVARREEAGLAQPLLRVRAWPLERVNGEPMDVHTVTDHVDELRDQVEPTLFQAYTPDAVPKTSIPAFQLAAVAYARDDALGERVSLALRDALFEDGQDVGDPAVLDAIRRRFGLPEPDDAARQAVDDDYADGQRLGVRGSPEYFLDGEGFFCPALRMEEVDGSLAIESASETFDAFIDACFG